MSQARETEMRLLLDEMRSGSLAAFERFYEHFASLVFQIAYKMTGDRMEAEDVCHDVFLEIFHKADQYDPARGSLEAWLAVRTKSRALDRMRKKQRVKLEPVKAERVESAEFPISTEERVVTRLEREAVLTALSNIPDPQRTAVYGMYYEFKTQRELSQKLHRPLGTVKSLIRYGLNSLRKELRAAGWMESAGGAGKHEAP